MATTTEYAERFAVERRLHLERLFQMVEGMLTEARDHVVTIEHLLYSPKAEGLLEHGRDERLSARARDDKAIDDDTKQALADLGRELSALNTDALKRAVDAVWDVTGALENASARDANERDDG